MKRAMIVLLALLFGLLSVCAFAGQEGSTMKELVKMQKAQKAAKASYLKSPKNAKLKKAYVDATVKLGTATMMSGALPAKKKYREALFLYREALKVDPTNVEAKNNKQLIEDVYRSMGRPIPK